MKTPTLPAAQSRVRHQVRRLGLASLGAFLLTLTAISPASANNVRPSPTPQLPGGLQSKLNTGLGLAMGVAVFAAVLGVIIVAFLLFLAARRGSLEDHMGRLGAVLAGCVLLGGASSLVMFMI